MYSKIRAWKCILMKCFKETKAIQNPQSREYFIRIKTNKVSHHNNVIEETD